MITWRNTTGTWGAFAKLLHWLIAALVLALLVVGFLMHDIEDFATRITVIQIHKSLGLVVLALLLLRAGWRLIDPPPALPAGMARWERVSAHLGHLALYGLLLVQPLTGLMSSFASGFPIDLFLVFDIPSPIDRDKELQRLAGTLHEVFAFAFIAMILIHVAAALRHQFWLRDGLITRMLPGRFRPAGAPDQEGHT